MKGFAQALLAHPNLVILDTETTDLEGYLVQLSVLRASDGEVLLDTFINPCCAISPEAKRVHGITAAHVADAPKFTDIEKTLRELLAGKLVAVFNLFRPGCAVPRGPTHVGAVRHPRQRPLAGSRGMVPLRRLGGRDAPLLRPGRRVERMAP